MNIITGMIRPETNCAPKDALNSSSFSSAKTSSTSRCRPNTFTRSWPVNVSSMCALSRPVRRHCWMNIPCDRFMIRAVTHIATGP